MKRMANYLLVGLAALVVASVGYNAMMITVGFPQLDFVRAVAISNTLIALTVGLALGWGALTIRVHSAGQLAGRDRVVALGLAVISLAWLATAAANLRG